MARKLTVTETLAVFNETWPGASFEKNLRIAQEHVREHNEELMRRTITQLDGGCLLIKPAQWHSEEQREETIRRQKAMGI